MTPTMQCPHPSLCGVSSHVPGSLAARDCASFTRAKRGPSSVPPPTFSGAPELPQPPVPRVRRLTGTPVFAAADEHRGDRVVFTQPGHEHPSFVLEQDEPVLLSSPVPDDDADAADSYLRSVGDAVWGRGNWEVDEGDRLAYADAHGRAADLGIRPA